MSSGVIAGELDAEGRDDTVLGSARDAFGEQVGLDRLGLYSEAQVRGFDLL